MPTRAAFEAQPQPQLRPVRADDRAAMRRFVQALDAADRRLRFHGGVKPESDRLLDHLTQADGVRHIALVAVLPCDDGELIVGEARCVRGSADAAEAEFAISIAAAWQGRGLAAPLMQALMQQAAAQGVEELAGDVLAGNLRMAGFMQRQGFSAAGEDDEGVQRWVRRLPAPRATSTGQAAPGWAGWIAGLRQRWAAPRRVHA